MLTRRELIGGLSTIALPNFTAFAATKKDLSKTGCAPSARNYSISMLGDTHYDKDPIELYHSEYIRLFRGKKENQWGFAEIPRNVKMWQGLCKEVLVASGKAVRSDCAFVLQLGDLVQGDCCDAAIHMKMVDDAITFMRGAYPEGLPFLTVCGNHDIRGGIREVNKEIIKRYGEYVTKFAPAQLGRARMLKSMPTGATFGFKQGPDLFIVADFNRAKESAAVVKKLLAENLNSRYTFLIVHGGIFPYDYWSRYFYLGEPRFDGLRREVRSLLASRNAIVLCGHTHRLELREAKFSEGLITEMTLNTVNDHNNPAEPTKVREGVETYGADHAFLAKISGGEELFNEYRPYMTRHYHADALGHGILRVSDESVEFDYFGHNSITPTKTFKLR